VPAVSGRHDGSPAATGRRGGRWAPRRGASFPAAAGALAPLEFLADLVSIGTLFAFVIVSAAVWIMRVTDPQAERPFRAPLVPLVSTMGILVNGAMMFFLGPENWLRLLVWLVMGLMIYFGYSRRHSALRLQPAEAAAPR